MLAITAISFRTLEIELLAETSLTSTGYGRPVREAVETPMLAGGCLKP